MGAIAALVGSLAVAFWSTLCDMAPYLLFGFAAAGLLSVFVSAATVERHLGGRGLWPVVKASLFGVPLPLCSCAVIPVAASLRRHGSSRGATAAFLLATPQTSVDSILATFSLLGPVYAVFRPVAALISGVLGGCAVDVFGGQEGTAPEHCEEACCCGGHRGGRLATAFRFGFVTLPRDLGRALLGGLLVAALITTFVPPRFFTEIIGSGFMAMVIMMLLGIPIYVCATASIPVAAAMIAKGVTPGAALVFLMTGPATNAAAIATIWRMFGPRTTAVYLAVVAVSALGAGLALDLMFEGTLPVGGEMSHLGLPVVVKWLCGVALVVVLVAAMWPRKRGATGSGEHPAGGSPG